MPDTVIAVYTGACTALTEVDYADDTGGSCAHVPWAVLDTPVRAGTIYTIGVGKSRP